MNYLDFWNTKAEYLENIVPDDFIQPQGKEETWNILKPLLGDNIVDFGCGYGRLAEYFSIDNYLGIDISDKSLNGARIKFPDHKFEKRNIGDLVPDIGTVIAYTVLLHVPDDLIHNEINAIKHCKRVIIAEMCGKKWRNGDGIYVFNREIEDYKKMMGRDCSVINIPNIRYSNEDFTFMVFEK